MTKNYMRSSIIVFAMLSVFLTQKVVAQNSYTFTNCGATGRYGPTQAQANTAYTLTNLQGSVVVSATGIQTWTVPTTGPYRIRVVGAQGGSGTNKIGGRGTTMVGDFNLTSGQVLKILVGQEGSATNNYYGGGGGSYVATNANVPLIVAGGGGGAGGNANGNGIDAVLTTSGTAGSAGGAGGTNGNGGSVANSNGGAGGGFYTDGGGTPSAAQCSVSAGRAFVNGGEGGQYSSWLPGGFGGGGGGWSSTGNGGGGGYSGGGTSGSSYVGGGGGGSYNAGTNQTNSVGLGTGHGKVVITELCNITIASSITNTTGAICSGNSVTLTTNAISNYSWSTGANTQSIVVSPTATTIYTLSATHPTANCTGYTAISIVVSNTLPTLQVSNTSTASGNGICPNASVALTATVTSTGPTTYTWTGGVNNGVTFFPSSTSGYTVTAENACGTSTAATSVSIHPVPTVTATVSQPTICSGNTATFVGTSGSNPPAVSYVWQAANNNNPTNGQGYFATVSQNYTVIGTSALGCTAQAVTALGVTQTPILAPVVNPGSALICIGSSATISVSGAAGYSWAPVGTFTGSSAPSITVDPTSTTTYTITKWNANCVDTKTVTITVNQLPFVFAVGSTTVVCAGKPATLSVGGGISYTWTSTPSVNLPSGAQANNIVVTPIANTDYTVAASDGTCVNTTTLYMQVDPNPTINIATTASVLCRNDCATLTLSGADTYTWAPSTITGTLAVVCPTAPISYSVGGTNSFGCVSSKQQVIVVNQLPNITASANRTLVCTGGPSTITALGTPGPVSYSWSSGALTNSTVVNPLNTSVYEVTVAINSTGCRSTRTVQVSVYVPTVCVTNTSVCYGGTVTICASCAQSYTWANPGSNFACVPVSPSVTTIYTVAAASTSNNVQCSTTQTLQVDIYAQPTVSAVAERTLICRYEEVNLIAGGANSYTWSNSMQGGTVTVKPLSQTTYSVIGTDVFGCKDTNFVVVKVSTCPGIKENGGGASISIFPNPSKGHFTIVSSEKASLSLYNGLGQLVRNFELSAGNSYKADVADLAKGVYFITGKEGENSVYRKIIIE
jgi:hypothetical protein